jgi:hypothetical protein
MTDLRAFVEFKHYWHAQRHDPYSSRQCGFKAGQLEEFARIQSCVEHLAARRVEGGLSKYIVLFYADRAEETRRKWTYAKHYDDYRHHHNNVNLRLVDTWGPVVAGGGVVRASLYEVNGVDSPSVA